MELILKSATVDLPSEIANLESLKAELIPRLEKYKSLVVTEESIKAAKEDKANLNKLKKALETQRINVKKQYLEPYYIIEEQCKQVLDLINEPIKAIDEQIKAFGDEEKFQKRKALELYFDGLHAPEWITLEDVLNPKWENKTQKVETLQAEIKDCCNRYLEEFDRLIAMYKEFPHRLAIEQKYKECKDFSKTAVYAVKLDADYRKAQRIHDIAESTQNASESPQSENSIITPPTVQNANTSESEHPEPIGRVKFEVECTKSALIALRDYMKSNEIKFKVIKE